MSAAAAVDDAGLLRLAQAVAAALLARGERLATAESCTGGWIAAQLTDLPGSSAWFERGVVSYSNEAKQTLLGVPDTVLAAHGAVSAATVLAMADGLRARAPVAWTLAVSGIAGPGGGSADKPVGTVHIGWAGPGIATSSSRFRFTGDREAVRRASVAAALSGLLALLAAAPAAASEFPETRP